MLRCHTCINRLILYKGNQFLIGILIQHGTFYRFVHGFQNTNFLCNGRSGYNMVSSNHNRLNTGSPALCNCPFGFRTRRIHHCNQAQILKVILIFCGNGTSIKRLGTKAEHPQPLPGQQRHLILNFLNLFGTALHAVNHNVRSTLGIQYSSLLRANQSRHQLSIRIKWYFADPLALLPQRICINLELLSKPNQCCFSWIAQLFSVATDCIAAQNGGSQ